MHGQTVTQARSFAPRIPCFTLARGLSEQGMAVARSPQEHLALTPHSENTGVGP